MNTKIVVGITQGDSNGIGYEVIIKSLSDSRIFDIGVPVVYGSSKIMGFYKKQIPDSENIPTNIISKAEEAHSKRVNIINCVPDTFMAEPGKATEEGSKAAILALESAVNDLKRGVIDVLVTAPFNKSSVSKEGFSFPGHTEYLTKEFGSDDSLMFMISDNIRVGLVTNHVPLAEVSKLVTKERIMKKLAMMCDSLRKDFAVDRPKIAVLSLNPHNGDGGLLGREEEEVIKPAIREMFDKGELVFGPFPPDGFFASDYKNRFDAVLAMYHDQGLIPFKSLSIESGVNYTAGLKVIRTSPDHGTAYDLAGKDKAVHFSMLSSIYLACDIFKNRKNYDLLRANPLKVEMPTGGREND
jgi:4-hydroxythreonine-4-phosphate dehydrogenase